MPQTLNEFLDEIERVGADLAKTRYANKDPISFPLIKAAKIIREMYKALKHYNEYPSRFGEDNGFEAREATSNIDKIINGEEGEK